jgi:hypothetical protein
MNGTFEDWLIGTPRQSFDAMNLDHLLLVKANTYHTYCSCPLLQYFGKLFWDDIMG